MLDKYATKCATPSPKFHPFLAAYFLVYVSAMDTGALHHVVIVNSAAVNVWECRWFLSGMARL